MKVGTKHTHLKCEERNCQRFGELLEYSKKTNSFICPDSLIANGEYEVQE